MKREFYYRGYGQLFRSEIELPELTPADPGAANVEIIVRPQHLDVHEDHGVAPPTTAHCGAHARGVVERARFMGAQSLIEVRMDHDGAVLRATVPYAFLPTPGTALWLGLRRDRCFVFPCKAQTKVASPFAAE